MNFSTQDDLSFGGFALIKTFVMIWNWYNILHLIIPDLHINKTQIPINFIIKKPLFSCTLISHQTKN